MISRRDYFLAVLSGILSGILLQPTVHVANFPFPYAMPLVVVGMPLVMAIGLRFGVFISAWFSWGIVLAKYVIAGILSFSLDIAALNALSLLTGVTAGIAVGWVNIPGFLIGLINAYGWNHFWVFPNRDRRGNFERFPAFFLVVLVGLMLNSAIIAGLTTYFSPPQNLSPRYWLNISKIIAMAVSIIWNFLGYKFIAFR